MHEHPSYFIIIIDIFIGVRVLTSTSMQAFETYAQQIIKQEQIPGVGIGINEQGTTTYDHGFGYRNIAKNKPVTNDTIFGIGSMTKSFTCVAIMQLQEAGKLSVHDPVIKYLPKLRVPHPTYGEKITIHHLMTHTSGIPPLKSHVYARKRSVDQDPAAKDYGLNLVNNQGRPIDTYDDLIQYLADESYKLLGKPGTEYSYANDTYGLLAAIIEKVSEQTYDEYLKTNIFQPLKMTRTFILLDELENFDNITELYIKKQSDDNPTVYAAPVWWDAPALRATGYIKSTVTDILNYLNSLLGIANNPAILSQESIDQLFHPHVEYEPGKYYGYGFRITPNYTDGITLIEHGGGLKGVSSMMCLIPEKQLTATILTNLSSVPADRILLGALNNRLGKPFDYKRIEYKTTPLKAEKLENYAGTYASEEGMKVTFSIKNEQLMIKEKTEDIPLSYMGNNEFFIPENNQYVRFIKNKHGNIERVFYKHRQINKITT